MLKIVTTFLLACCALWSYSQSTEMRPGIQRLVNKLREGKMIHFGYPVGYGGRPETNNWYYKTYLVMKDKAADDELVQLTKDEDPTIVIYSFSILLSRNSNRLKDIFSQHSNDTTGFWTAGGCTGVYDKVNWFMLRSLKPTAGLDNRLTKEEFSRYCSQFKKEDELFFCSE